MTILLLIFSFFFILFGIFIFTINRPVYSILLLILNFILASFILFLLNMDFLALSFIMIYVGALAVLFLFVIMMIDTKEEVSFFDRSNLIFYFFITLFIELVLFIILISVYDFVITFLVPIMDQNIFKKNDFYSVISKLFVSIEINYSWKIKGLSDLVYLIQIENYAHNQYEIYDALLKDAQNSFSLANDEKSLLEAKIKFEKVKDLYPVILGAVVFAMSYSDLFIFYHPNYCPLYYFLAEAIIINHKLHFDFVNPILVFGQSIYNAYGILFVIAGFILVIAFIGAISLTLKFQSILKKKKQSSIIKKGRFY